MRSLLQSRDYTAALPRGIAVAFFIDSTLSMRILGGNAYFAENTHNLNLGVYVGDGNSENLIAQSICFANRPCSCATTIHKGTLPLENSFAGISGCILTSMKRSEDNSGVVLRVYNPWNEKTEVRIQFDKKLRFAEEVAIPEWKLDKPVSIEGNTIIADIPQRSIMTIKADFQ